MNLFTGVMAALFNIFRFDASVWFLSLLFTIFSMLRFFPLTKWLNDLNASHNFLNWFGFQINSTSSTGIKSFNRWKSWWLNEFMNSRHLYANGVTSAHLSSNRIVNHFLEQQQFVYSNVECFHHMSCCFIVSFKKIYLKLWIRLSRNSLKPQIEFYIRWTSFRCAFMLNYIETCLKSNIPNIFA